MKKHFIVYFTVICLLMVMSGLGFAAENTGVSHVDVGGWHAKFMSYYHNKGLTSGTTTTTLPTNTSTSDDETENSMIDLKITIGNSTFDAKLYDNDSTQALIQQLPVTVDMGELNGNEKYYFMASNLPADSTHQGQIQAGEFMLYGNNCLVLFYETFSSPYNYTRLGHIENIVGFSEALGNGKVRVTFAVS